MSEQVKAIEIPEMLQTIELKNGAMEARSIVVATMISLRHLFNNDPITAYELVEKCKDNNHQLFGNCGDKLKNLALVDNNNGVHSSIKNIVLSAIDGEGMGLSLGNPAK